MTHFSGLYAALYVLAWLTLVNLAWALPAGLTPFTRLLKCNAWYCRGGDWLMACALLLAAGAIIDHRLADYPHHAWQNPVVYGVFLSLSALFAFPGMLYWQERAKKI